MHELSIAMSIVDIAVQKAESAAAGSVMEVELDIGVLAGIEYPSLEFALDMVSRDTLLENTLFRINRIEPVSECQACHHLFTPKGVYNTCPECLEMNTRLIHGREMQIKSLLIE